MAELAGSTCVVKISTTDGSYAAIDSVDDATMNKLAEILEITALGDTYRNRIAGIKDTEISISGSYNPADTTGQTICVPGNSVWIEYLPNGTAGFKVNAICESFEMKASADGRQEFSSSFKGLAAPSAVS